MRNRRAHSGEQTALCNCSGFYGMLPETAEDWRAEYYSVSNSVSNSVCTLANNWNKCIRGVTGVSASAGAPY